jgi:hypothetical protein
MSRVLWWAFDVRRIAVTSTLILLPSRTRSFVRVFD